MNKLTFLAVFFFGLACCAQESYSRQFSIITDNDLYTSEHRDKYYTSGIFLSYKYASKKSKNSEIKRIYEYKIGHEMYTPQKAIVRTIEEHDRPFAAYLFGEYGITRVFEDQFFFDKLSIRYYWTRCPWKRNSGFYSRSIRIHKG